MNWINIIPLVLLVLVVAGLSSFWVYDKITGKHTTCTVMGWHNGKGDNSGNISFDGCSAHATCSKCGAQVMQDSQGNWF